MPTKKTLAELAREMKDVADVLDKLRSRRREIKLQLTKELKESEEEALAEELHQTSRAIQALERERVAILGTLNAPTGK